MSTELIKLTDRPYRKAGVHGYASGIAFAHQRDSEISLIRFCGPELLKNKVCLSICITDMANNETSQAAIQLTADQVTVLRDVLTQEIINYGRNKTNG